MDLTMSSSVTMSAPSLLFATPSSPPPSSPATVASQTTSQHTSVQPPTTSTSTSNSMDLSTSIPSLPAAAAPPDHDMDATMTDAEALSDGHPPEVEEIDGEQSEPASDSTLRPNAANHGSQQQLSNDTQPAVNSTPNHTVAGHSQDTHIDGGPGQDPPQTNGSATPEHAMAEVNGTTESVEDAMDTAEAEADEHTSAAMAPAPPNVDISAGGAPSVETDTAAAAAAGSQPAHHSPEPPTPEASPEHEDTMDPEDQSGSDASSDTDEHAPTRAEFMEDPSSPDEEELKEIESGTERLGNDHQAFEKLFFTDLSDPEHIPADTGRIEWTLTGVRGTWERPNKEALMTSPTVRIGDLDWNVKFYPKGNQTDHISVYLEASKPASKSASPEQGPESPAAAGEASESATTSQQAATEEPASAPAPETGPGSDAAGSQRVFWTDQGGSRADGDLVPVAAMDVQMSMSESDMAPVDAVYHARGAAREPEWSMAAQFGIVMYNPAEPRVYVCQGMQHRFRRSSPDWGWTRFHGPYSQMHKRQRGQRQAILRNDTLAFTAYIRIIKDDTQTLWDDDPFGPAWDSLAKTGLRGLRPKRSEESFIPAAIASWALLAPFREAVYGVPTGDPLTDQSRTPKLLVTALQRVLHRLQAQQKPCTSPVSLEPINNFLSAMGSAPFLLYDVVDFWELLRNRLDHELRGTDMEGKLADLFDGRLQRVSGAGDETGVGHQGSESSLSAGMAPPLRLPVRGAGSVQAAFASVLNGQNGGGRATIQKPPKFMQVELDRQMFDEASRSWKKVVEKIELNEHLDLTAWNSDPHAEATYTLYGLVAHTGSLSSGRYHAVLRPGGPGTRWYAYLPRTETVVCRTRKQAIDDHEGVAPGKEGTGTEAVAYVLMYVRDDAIPEVLQGLPERPEAPQWIKDELDREAKAVTAHDDEDMLVMFRGKPIDVRIFGSRLFQNYAELGIFNLYNATKDTLQSTDVINLSLKGDSRVSSIQRRLADLLGLKGDPRQCQLHRFDVTLGLTGRAGARFPTDSTLARESLQWPSLQYWLVIIPPAAIEFKGGSEKAPVTISAWNDAQVLTRRSSSDAETASGASKADTVEVPSDVDPSGIPAAEAGNAASPPTVQGGEQQGMDSSADRPDTSEDAAMPDAADTSPSAHEDEGDRSGNDMEVETTPTTASGGPSEQEQAQAPPAPPQPQQQPPQQAQAQQQQRRTGSRAEGSHGRTSARRPKNPQLDALLNSSILVFVKRFDVRAQSLRGVGSCLVPKSDGIGSTMRTLLEIPPDQSLRVWEEVSPQMLRQLGSAETFRDEMVGEGAILVVGEALSEEETRNMEEQGQFASLSQFAQWTVETRHGSFAADDEIEYHYFSGRLYAGARRHGYFHGSGRVIEVNGDQYRGPFVLGKRQGPGGRMLFHNGDVYEGDWRDDRMHGQGRYVHGQTGNTYVGGFRAGRRHGRGRMDYVVAEDELKMCQICYEEEMDCVFYDCGHVCACLRCAKQVEECPLCRKSVSVVVKVYWS